MLVYTPFLITSLAFGIISLIIFMVTNVVLMIPVMATRGTSQFLWFAAGGFLLTVEIAVLVTLGVLVSNGTIWS
ncbi:hypothetical protein AYO38_07440 [bacterium SCGC AG-212-C10]|nr:hypothetical protein AYO38_07440 [bacterium SCGC AG-212-C10]